MFAVLMWFYNLRIASYELPGPTDKEKPGGGGQGAPSWQPGPKVVPFSDFTCAYFQEAMSLFSIIKTTYCFIFS